MPGLLVDVNVEGHLDYLVRRIESQGLLEFLTVMGISFTNFPALGLHSRVDDRTLWNFCQSQGWMLLTANRNHDHENSLNATIQDS